MVETSKWYTLPRSETLRQLATNQERGLTFEEAALRRKHHGSNQLGESPRPGFIQLLGGQFNNFVMILLVVAALVSAVIGEWIDSAAILAIVLLNAALGVTQELRAEKALSALARLAAPAAQVLRNGRRQIVPAQELVPGDIVFLEAGNSIPADLRLLETVNLRIEEAALTGESIPVPKDASLCLEADAALGDRKNCGYMGTTVSYGRGLGVVTSTGMHTQIGLIATMLQGVGEEQTPLQKHLDRLGKTLGWAALALCGFIFLVAVLRTTDLSMISGNGLAAYLNASRQQLLQMFMLAVGLAIAAVPEGLPAVVTISLALGMREMVKRHALIRRLGSVETLGSTTTICTDKTGTLTQNEMTLSQVWVDGRDITISGRDYSLPGEFLVDGRLVNINDYPGALTAIWIGALNNDAELQVPEQTVDEQGYRISGDPTEGALIAAAVKAGALPASLDKSYPRAGEIPFDSVRKRMLTIHRIAGPRAEDISPFSDSSLQDQFVVAVKGAPDLVLALCTRYQRIDDTAAPLDEAARLRILAANDAMTVAALRLLGVAFKVVASMPDPEDVRSTETGLTFAGLLGMIDPARPEVGAALQTAASAGIHTIMITGDYPNTARAIAEAVGLLRRGGQMLTGADVDRITDAELMRRVGRTDVFARVSPEHKLRIVQALRASGEVVAMTGDGVNDAPSIKAADIGIAMGVTGTDVAREAADMVLTDDNYASIVAAVEQGRIIYDNIRTFVFFLLSSNVAEILVIFLATVAGLPPPLTVVQLLWLNLLTDGAPALALAMEKGGHGIMRRAPRSASEPIINRTMQWGIIIQGVAQTTAVLGAFGLGLLWHLQAAAGNSAAGNPLALLLQTDWRGAQVQAAQTMAFATLSLCELFRAYTVRSARLSVFQLGVFSNCYLQYGAGISLALLLATVQTPLLNPVFNTLPMSISVWSIIVGLAMVPAIVEEITKAFLRGRGPF